MEKATWMTYLPVPELATIKRLKRFYFKPYVMSFFEGIRTYFQESEKHSTGESGISYRDRGCRRRTRSGKNFLPV